MNFLEKHSLTCGTRELELKAPVVMGIINLTPDSFYDGGAIDSPDTLIEKVTGMVNEGASIIDVGALSTRPGSEQFNAEEELKRLMPSFTLLRKKFPETIFSIDTYRKKVAEAVINEGADIINDISGGVADEEMISYMCSQNAAYVLMHMQGTPENMQQNPQYTDVVKDVAAFFMHQTAVFKKAGKHNIILDPGFGFGKTVEHNYQLLSGIAEFTSLCYPILAGVSRKSMINRVLNTTPSSALNGTTVVNTIALLRGASILRVHDVKEAIEAINIFMTYKHSILA